MKTNAKGIYREHMYILISLVTTREEELLAQIPKDASQHSLCHFYN